MEKRNNLSVNRAVLAKRESKHVDFKEKFDPNQVKDWCEIIKDIVAMANSGGGLILFGVRNDGSPSGEDVFAILKLDAAKTVDKIAKYTGHQFDKFTILEADRKGAKIAVLQIDGVFIPMAFVESGTYVARDGRTKTAFTRGSVYFRHGAKSEPGNSEDLRKSFERELNRVRKSWLGNIRKVVYAPSGHKIRFVAPQLIESDSTKAYRKVWDKSPYQEPQEIVIGTLKSWKRDKTSYASESDVWTVYTCRNSIQLDEEKAECLLESAINRHAPFFFFAKSLPHSHLLDFIKQVAVLGKYPAPNMVTKLAHAIGGRVGSELLDYVADNCSYSSTKRAASNLKKTVLKRSRIKKLYGKKVKIGTRAIEVETAKTSDLEGLMGDAISAKDKAAVKQLDALLYGPLLEAKPKM